MNIKKGLVIGLATLGFSISANAGDIQVGGITWDPDETFSFALGTEDDYGMDGELFESVVELGSDVDGDGVIEPFVVGWGTVDEINGRDDFLCAGCMLTMTFSMDFLSSTTTADGVDFKFENLMATFWVGQASDFAGLDTLDDLIAMSETQLSWLELEGFLNPLTGAELDGSADEIGTGGETGEGSALLEVVGGVAAFNFDTDTQNYGTDFVLNSQFLPVNNLPLLEGGFQLKGDSIPEPASIALLALGLLGFAARRKA